MIDGKTIQVGGKDHTLPPMNWKVCKKFYKEIVGVKVTDLSPDIMGELVHSALARNYPELTQEDFEDQVSPGELLGAIPLLLEISGFVSLGEAPGGGEKKKK